MTAATGAVTPPRTATTARLLEIAGGLVAGVGGRQGVVAGMATGIGYRLAAIAGMAPVPASLQTLGAPWTRDASFQVPLSACSARGHRCGSLWTTIPPRVAPHPEPTMRTPPLIRTYQETDWPAVWPILHTTFRAGDTYSFDPEITEAESHKVWIELPAATFVAGSPEGRILGTYFIKPNQPGLGSHVCNCGYVVAPEAQGQGIATDLCEHSQDEAVLMGFRAMQFNFVVATNERAIRLWQRLGFDVVGRLPGAFRHQSLGFVDALIMFKQLVV
jgi:ribosomal protein S18 acetylase RimI-like enzyme